MAAHNRARTTISGQTVALALLLMALAAPAGTAEMSETVLPNGLRVVLRLVQGNPVVCSAVLVWAGGGSIPGQFWKSMSPQSVLPPIPSLSRQLDLGFSLSTTPPPPPGSTTMAVAEPR